MDSAVSKTTNSNKNFSWPGGSSAIKQYFSLPSSFIYFISKNPSTPEAYQKLVQSCKYFFEKLPLLVVKRIIDDNGRKMCTEEHHFYSFDGQHYIKKNPNCCINIDRATNKNIWLTDKLIIDEKNMINILPKIYRSENAVLYISRDKMDMKQYTLWASKFQKFNLFHLEITDVDGRTVMLEKIIEAFPNVIEFDYTFKLEPPAATATTMKDISKLLNHDNLDSFSLYYIPEVIPVDDISLFINAHKNTAFRLSFHNASPLQKMQLDKLIDIIILSNRRNCCFFYGGQDEKKRKIMEGRYDYKNFY